MLDEKEESEGNKENNNIDVDLSIDTIFNILLINPGDYEPKSKPMGIRHNYVCTLDLSKVSLDMARADDNGAYIRKGSPRKLYYVKVDDCEAEVTPAKAENGVYFIHERNDDPTVIGSRYRKRFVAKTDVYELQRHYRVSKLNDFTHVIITVKRLDSSSINNYYMVLYKWNDGKDHAEDDFITERHGNAKKPHCGTYYRQDPQMLEKAKDLLTDGAGCSKAYFNLTKDVQVILQSPVNCRMLSKNIILMCQLNSIQGGDRSHPCRSIDTIHHRN